MATYEDMFQLARICLRQACNASNSEASAALLSLADEYGRRAAELENSAALVADKTKSPIRFSGQQRRRLVTP